jgi:hypothetical protein
MPQTSKATEDPIIFSQTSISRHEVGRLKALGWVERNFLDQEVPLMAWQLAIDTMGNENHKVVRHVSDGKSVRGTLLISPDGLIRLTDAYVRMAGAGKPAPTQSP